MAGIDAICDAIAGMDQRVVRPNPPAPKMKPQVRKGAPLICDSQEDVSRLPSGNAGVALLTH